MCTPGYVQVGHDAVAGRGRRHIFPKSLRVEELSVQRGTYKAIEIQRQQMYDEHMLL